MNKLILIIIFFFISNCTLNKVVKHHGIHILDKKQKKLVLNSTNKNDIVNLLGPPSTKSTFDNDVWIYVERKTSKSSVFKLKDCLARSFPLIIKGYSYLSSIR